MCCQMYQNYAINCRYIWLSWFYNGLLVWGLSSAGRAPALQAGGSGFESRRLHQTENKLKKPLHKCRGFSRSFSKVSATALIKCLTTWSLWSPLNARARVRERGVRCVWLLSASCPDKLCGLTETDSKRLHVKGRRYPPRTKTNR